mgnify:CR=1 FL=1
MSLKSAKRVFIVSDTHLGCRSNSKEWLDIVRDYFFNFFIPLVKREYREGDILFHLGDVFDNRQSVNLFAMHYAIEIFEELSKTFKEIHILVGNHDIARKQSNEITGLDIFKHFQNIKIYKHAELIELGSKKALMMPWRRDKEHEIETLIKYPHADYLFCHSEFQGVQLSRNPKNRHDGGNDVDNFKFYNKVYSGHIHYRQKRKNFLMVGNPYEMTRSDLGNQKGIYLLDIETGEEEFFVNDFSPKFMKINLKDALNMSIGDLKSKINNNFIDLFISSETVIKYNLSSLMNLIEGYARKIEPNIYENEVEMKILMDDTEEDSTSYKNFDIMTISKKYIEATNYDEDFKKRLISSIKELYKETNK